MSETRPEYPGTPSPWTPLWKRFGLVFKATAIAGVLGFALLALGELVKPWSLFWSEVIIDGGKVVVVTSVIGLIFEFLMHEHFVERVKQQVISVDSQVRELGHTIERLQKSVAITSGAIESGLSAVYSDRQKAFDEIAQLLANARFGEHLRIVGISVGDYLCPHGRLYQPMIDALGRGIHVQALLLDMHSEAAHMRAELEERKHMRDTKFESPEWLERYKSTTCFGELKTASDGASTCADLYLGKPDGATSGIFEARLYNISPLCFLTILGSTMFLESYHYAGRGGRAPILRITEESGNDGRSSQLFDIYVKHFEVLWDLANSISDEDPRQQEKT